MKARRDSDQTALTQLHHHAEPADLALRLPLRSSIVTAELWLNAQARPYGRQGGTERIVSPRDEPCRIRT